MKCIVCDSTPQQYRDIRNQVDFHAPIVQHRRNNGAQTPLDLSQPVILCMKCYQMIHDLLQNPESMSIQNILTNTSDTAASAPFSNESSISNESDEEVIFPSEKSDIPSSESLLAVQPQSSESLTREAPDIRTEAKQIISAPGPKGVKRKRVLDLFSRLPPEDISQSQDLLEMLDAQSEPEVDLMKFMKNLAKKTKPSVKRHKPASQNESSVPRISAPSSVSSSQSVDGLVVDTSSETSKQTLSQPMNKPPSQQIGSEASLPEPVASLPPVFVEPPRPAVAQKQPRAPAAEPLPPKKTKTPPPTAKKAQPKAAPAPQPGSQSSSSSSSDMPPPRPDARRVHFNDPNPHSNMAAPRRITNNDMTPSAGSSGRDPRSGIKNLGG